jgi:hypothetical protein
VDYITKHEAVISIYEQKEKDTQKKYEEALQRERAKRERVDEVHSNDVKQAVLQTERKNDKAWQKVCSTLQSQLVLLQTQLAQCELQHVRRQAQWDFTESNYKTTGSALRAEVTV